MALDPNTKPATALMFLPAFGFWFLVPSILGAALAFAVTMVLGFALLDVDLATKKGPGLLAVFTVSIVTSVIGGIVGLVLRLITS